MANLCRNGKFYKPKARYFKQFVCNSQHGNSNSYFNYMGFKIFNCFFDWCFIVLCLDFYIKKF